MVPEAPGGAAPMELCTVVGSYVAQAVVLHRSLRELRPEARLTVLCTDAGALESLRALGLPGLAPLDVRELTDRDPRLAAIRPERTLGEYCWSVKPSLLLHLLDRAPGAAGVVYLDADLMFLSDPEPLEAGLSDAAIGILPHRFARRYRRRAGWAGTYNTAWMWFRRSDSALEALRWWRERCIEWCYDRAEGGRFGDQGYLTDWPRRFDGVRVVTHPGAGLAPWTDNRGLARRDGSVWIDRAPVLFHHYQSLELYRPGRLAHRPLLPGAPFPLMWRIYRGYRIGRAEREVLWDPYLERLGRAVADLATVQPGVAGSFPRRRARDLTSELRQHLWMRVHDMTPRVRR